MGTACTACLPRYFENDDLQGEPTLRRNESRAYFDMEMEPADVIAAVGKEHYSIRWTATLTPAFAGEYQLTVRTNRWNRTGKAPLFLDDVELEFGGGPTTQMTSTHGRADPLARPLLATVRLEAGRAYRVRVEFRQIRRGRAPSSWRGSRPRTARLPRPRSS